MDDSGVNATFGFGKPDVNNDKQIVEDKTPQIEKSFVSSKEERDAKLDEEYIDERSVTIALVRNYSKFRESNRSSLPKKVDYIGSCITTSRVLCSNKEEMNAYFPQLIGVSPSSPDYLNRVKLYLNNIQVKVDELGKTFNNSFIYNHYKDYLKFAKEEENIVNRYKAVNRQNLAELKKGLKRYIDDMNTLESRKYNYGHPVNLEDYIMYRHCLLYNDIAKDTILINSNSNIRFYFKDDRKEADRLRKFRTELNKAKANYVSAMADYRLFEAIYIQYLVLNNLPIIASLMENEIDKQIKLDKFSQDEPVKFNKLFKDNDIKLKSTIELLIAHGIIIRSTYNQNITTVDGDLIGANMLDVVTWFKNPENNAKAESYFNQLKNI